MRLLITLIASLVGLRMTRHWGGALAGAVLGRFASAWLEQRLRPASATTHEQAATTDNLDIDLSTLGLKRGASQDDIEQAWRRLMARYHPDRATETGRAEAERRSGEINAAYRRLRRRKRH
ncbi:MAG: J domain-containing protein [Xanthomonadales bacterium]|nr:J domain-containing protein [Xanthomonadales bacterium]